jgi:membrane protease YdiL (CAAX protease family)
MARLEVGAASRAAPVAPKASAGSRGLPKRSPKISAESPAGSMQTSIGRSLRDSPRRLFLSVSIAICAVASDLGLTWWDHYPDSIVGRWWLALVAPLALLHLAKRDPGSIGLNGAPLQGWRYWVRMTLIIGLLVGALSVSGLWFTLFVGWRIPIYRTPIGLAGYRFLWMCVFVPVQEEAVYRLALCVPLAALARPRAAIILSGTIFAFLHIVYGNPSPENVVAGFFLAWAFLKADTIYVPLLMHSLGNCLALTAQVAATFFL